MNKDSNRLQFKNVICDADEHFEFLDFFLDHIKHLAVIAGVENFMKHMDVSSPTYYKKRQNSNLWTYEEMKKAMRYFKDLGIIQ